MSHSTARRLHIHMCETTTRDSRSSDNPPRSSPVAGWLPLACARDQGSRAVGRLRTYTFNTFDITLPGELVGSEILSKSATPCASHEDRLNRH